MSTKNERTNPASCANREKSNASRRRILRAGMLAGASWPFMPSEWSRPVVQSVLLPAHAQMSPDREDSAAQPESFTATRDCGQGPNNGYYTIVFPGNSASVGSSVSIEGPFGTDPRPVSGDNVVLRISNDADQVFLTEISPGFGLIVGPFCGDPDDSVDASIPLANGTNTLDFTVDINNQPGQIEITAREFSVN